MTLLQKGLYKEAQYVPSPNCDERPLGSVVKLLVVHGISLPPKEFGGPYIGQLFTNCLCPAVHPYFKQVAHLRVSAHVLIRRTGAMVQYVPFDKRAWHAGASEWRGLSGCNDFSIGIELEGADDVSYEPEQYQELVRLSRALMECYPDISLQNIVGHSDISPHRKTDPGPAFDWVRFKTQLER